MADVPPVLRAGVRVELLREHTTLHSTVVITSDARSYLEAIGRWTPDHRFPVLIDDGTRVAREDIARFVRAFKPAHVVRWAAADAPRRDDWKATRADIERSIARAWGWTAPQDTPPAAPSDFLATLWKQAGPIGVVVAHEDDHAWPAAVALAAGHAQPILWWKPPRGPEGVLWAHEGDDLSKQLETFCASLGSPWREIGDTIDAVTLCLDMPVKMAVGESDVVAVTDRVGRLGESAKADARWAFAGQVSAPHARAAYQAMAGLFLLPSSAWLFDGYPDTKPWNEYDATKAAEILRQRRLTITLDDSPRNGARDWRERASRPIDAGLVMVNTKGNADFFDLDPGTCKPGDVPLLNVPAIAYVVHSWSAQWPNRRDTVAGRWLEHGAYAYAGSVQEPYLQGFCPTPKVAQRLMAGVPFGAAVRFDDGKMWKIAVLGDPLIAMGTPHARDESLPPLERAADLADALPADLKAGRFSESLRTLALLGRDADALKLARTLQASKDGIDPASAAEAVLPAFRAGTFRDVLGLYARLAPADARDPSLRDALWLGALAGLDHTASDADLTLLRDNIRDDQRVRDAEDLARAWARKLGKASAQRMLDDVASRAADAKERDAIRAALPK